MKNLLIIFLIVGSYAAQAQVLTPTKDKAAVTFEVTDAQSKPVQTTLFVEDIISKAKFTGTTGSDGICHMLLPVGKVYYLTFSGSVLKYDIEVPNTPMLRISFPVRYKAAATTTYSPTNVLSLINFSLTDGNNAPMANTTLSLKPGLGDTVYTGTTDNAGKWKVLLRNSEVYALSLNGQHYSLISINDQPYKTYNYALQVKDISLAPPPPGKVEVSIYAYDFVSKAVPGLEFRFYKKGEDAYYASRTLEDGWLNILLDTGTYAISEGANPGFDTLWAGQKTYTALYQTESMAARTERHKQMKNSYKSMGMLWANQRQNYETRFKNLEKAKYDLSISDSVVISVLHKHFKWQHTAFVADAGPYMRPYIYQMMVYYLQKGSYVKPFSFVFYNATDKKNSNHIISCNSCAWQNALTTWQHTLNAVEDTSQKNAFAALDTAIHKTDVQTIIWVANNNCMPSDTFNLPNLKVPVHVIACGAGNGVPVNPLLMYVAWKSGGSLHVPGADMEEFGMMEEGKILLIGTQRYIFRNGMFYYIKG